MVAGVALAFLVDPEDAVGCCDEVNCEVTAEVVEGVGTFVVVVLWLLLVVASVEVWKGIGVVAVVVVDWLVPFDGVVTVVFEVICKREQQFALHMGCDNPHFRIRISMYILKGQFL